MGNLTGIMGKEAVFKVCGEAGVMAGRIGLAGEDVDVMEEMVVHFRF